MRLLQSFSWLQLCFAVAFSQDLFECADSPFGCCSSNETVPAHGPNDLGCCLLAEFGCCPDNIKAAENPYGEGCTECQDTEHGCCPDGTTPSQEYFYCLS